MIVSSQFLDRIQSAFCILRFIQSSLRHGILGVSELISFAFANVSFDSICPLAACSNLLMCCTSPMSLFVRLLYLCQMGRIHVAIC